MDYLNVDITVRPVGDRYAVTVGSERCDAEASMPRFEPIALENRILAFRIAMLRSGASVRRVVSAEERTMQGIGGDLFAALLSGDVLACFDSNRAEALRSGQGTRIRLRLDDTPELQGLPWEYLYDAREDRYLAVSSGTPFVRYQAVPNPTEPVVVGPPIRVLGVVASPIDLAQIDIDRERSILEEAVALLVAEGRLELTWLDPPTLGGLRSAIGGPGCQVLQFVGLGGSDERGEGFVVLTADDGRAMPLPARHLADVLDDQPSLRLAILAPGNDVLDGPDPPFTTTAGALVRRRTPAVLSIQSPMSDVDAVEFYRAFYGAIVQGIPVDVAVTEARKSLRIADRLSWGVPVLDTHTPDGVLFRMAPEVAETAPPKPLADADADAEQRAQAALREKRQAAETARAAEEQARTSAAVEAARLEVVDPVPRYEDLNIRIDRGPDGAYRLEVRAPDGRVTEGAFSVPFNDLELENFVLKVGQTRRATRAFRSDEMELAKTFGKKLLGALFPGDVRAVYQAARDGADTQDHGLRITLSLTRVPELMNIPWEFVWDRRFIAQSIYTPIIRSLDLSDLRPPRRIRPPLHILGVVSRPKGVDRLDVTTERRKLQRAIAPLEEAGLVTLEWLPRATLEALERRVGEPDEIHVLHFIGHGAYDDASSSGVLVFEDDQRAAVEVGGEELCAVLHDERSLRLAVLNSCEGARTSHIDPFSGVASALAECGIPAVIGMQFEITDAAAITFSDRLYKSLANGFPVDAAVAQARRGIFAAGNKTEFGTPVLLLRAAETRLFEIEQPDRRASV